MLVSNYDLEWWPGVEWNVGASGGVGLVSTNSS